MSETFTLSTAEVNTPVWFKIKGHLEQRLERVRGLNDAPRPEAETAALRGEIKALKGLLALGKELPPIETADGTDAQ